MKSKKIAKNIWAMGLVSFFNDIASETIYPLIPLFLTTTLGVSVATVGLIEGLAESTGNIVKVVSGWLSDKLEERKPIVITGYSLASFSKILLALAYVWPLALIARIADRLGKGIRTSARDALIAESSKAKNRGISFGLHRTLDTLGAVVGPLIAMVLIKLIPHNFHAIFYLASIPGFIAVFILVIFVKEHKKKIKVAKPLIKPIKLNFHFKMFVVISCIFALGNSSTAFLILRARNLGLSTTLTIVIYTLFNFAYASLSTPAGMLSDKIGAKKVLLIGFLLFSLVYLFLGLTQKSIYLWLLFPAYGIYMALTDGIGKAYISNLTFLKENLGLAFGIYQTTTGIATFFASFIAGLLWTHVSVEAAFIFGSVMALISGVMFLAIS
jgi:MFS family permease